MFEEVSPNDTLRYRNIVLVGMWYLFTSALRISIIYMSSYFPIQMPYKTIKLSLYKRYRERTMIVKKPVFQEKQILKLAIPYKINFLKNTLLFHISITFFQNLKKN